MKKIMTVLLLLCLLFNLAACQNTQEQPFPISDQSPSRTDQGTAVTLPEASGKTDFQKAFHMSQEDEFNRGCASETGYYFVGNAYLYYVEKETLRTTILCGKPECRHKDQSCNAYLGNVSHITYYDGKLYYAAGQEQGGIGGSEWNLYTMQADGTQKQKVQSLRTPNDGFFATPTQFLLHNGQVLFKSNHENILCAPMGGNLEAANMVKKNDLVADEAASIASLELWYLWADGDVFYCFGNPKANQFRNELYAYRPQTKELSRVWEIPSSKDVGKWDTSDVSVNGWYIDKSVLYYFLSGNGLYQYDINHQETKQIVALGDRAQTGTATFDGEYAYINNEESNMIFVYTLGGVFLGAYDYSEFVSQGVGQGVGSGVARVIGSDDKYVFLCAQNLLGMSQDGIQLGYSYYYLPKSEMKVGTGNFEPLAF